MKLNFDELVKQEIIDLSGKSLDDEDLEVIIKVLHDKNSAVKKLYLIGNGITLADGKFTDALANNNTVEEIHLINNKIGAEGAKCLAEALAKNNTLKVLYLYNNAIGVEGTRYLVDALKVNTALEMIYLSNNNIGEGVKYLARALMANSSLQYIDLEQNNISDEGAKSLATALLLNQGIRRMDMDNNKIGNEGAEKLAEALECNNTIETLWLGGDRISNSMMKKIDSIVNDTNRERKELTSQQWREIIAMKDEESADKVKAMVKQDRNIAKKDEEIAALKDFIDNSKSTVDTVDLTADDSELNNNKRPRTDDYPKKSLASILLDEKTQKLVQVKQEKNDVETTLEDTKEDLEDTREEFGNQVLYVNFLQGKIDELVELAEAAGADRSKIADIKGRLYSSR